MGFRFWDWGFTLNPKLTKRFQIEGSRFVKAFAGMGEQGGSILRLEQPVFGAYYLFQGVIEGLYGVMYHAGGKWCENLRGDLQVQPSTALPDGDLSDTVLPYIIKSFMGPL